MDAPVSSSLPPPISFLLNLTSVGVGVGVLVASSKAVTTAPDTVTSVLVVVFVTTPSATVNVVVLIVLYPVGAVSSSRVYVPLGSSIANCVLAVSQVIDFLSVPTWTLVPPVWLIVLKSMPASVELSFMEAPVSSSLPPPITFLLNLTSVGV